MEERLKIVLDPTQFGNIKQDKSFPLYNIYKVQDGVKGFITQRRLDPNNLELAAVTESQFKCWNGWNLIVERKNNLIYSIIFILGFILLVLIFYCPRLFNDWKNKWNEKKNEI